MSRRLILASASPRRRELLALLGLPFEVVPSAVEEDSQPPVSPPEFARALAKEKALDVWRRRSKEPGLMVLGADTIVVADRPGVPTILNKPTDEDDARRMLAWLSGTTHTVYTGLALVQTEAVRSDGEIETEVVGTRVTFRELTPSMIDAYVATGEPFDKAGAYGVQERAAPFVEAVHGDYFNVVGLPVCTVARMLERIGIEWWRGPEALEK